MKVPMIISLPQIIDERGNLSFIEENKHKINWYIENYERLEEEYFEKLQYERNKEFFTNKIMS